MHHNIQSISYHCQIRKTKSIRSADVICINIEGKYISSVICIHIQFHIIKSLNINFDEIIIFISFLRHFYGRFLPLGAKGAKGIQTKEDDDKRAPHEDRIYPAPHTIIFIHSFPILIPFSQQ